MFVSAKVPTETPAAITTSPGEWTRQIIPAILIRLAKTLPARDDPHALQTLMDTVRVPIADLKRSSPWISTTTRPRDY